MCNPSSGFSVFLLFVARVFISAIFIIAGVHKIMEYGHTLSLMSSMGVPLSEFMLILAIVFELGGGLLVFFGLFTRFGAFLLFVFVILVTYFFHSFWDYQAAAQVDHIYHFLKNLTILGGLLYVFVHGGGFFSLDRLFRKSG